jgi:hypothetical protein
VAETLGRLDCTRLEQSHSCGIYKRQQVSDIVHSDIDEVLTLHSGPTPIIGGSKVAQEYYRQPSTGTANVNKISGCSQTSAAT